MKNINSQNPQIFIRLLKYLKPYRALFIGGMVTMIIYGATEGALPFIIKYILDEVFASKNREVLYILPIVLIVFASFRGLMDFLQKYLMAAAGYNIIRDLRAEINNKLLEFSPGYFIVKKSGDLLSRITSDVTLLRTLLTDSFSSLLGDTIRLISLMSAAIYLDPFLGIVASLVFPLAVFPVYKIGRNVRKHSKKGQDGVGALTAMLTESIIGNKVIKIFSREEFEKNRFAENNNIVNKEFIKSEQRKAITGPLNEILASAAIAGVIWYGGYSVIHGLKSQGEFIAFITSVLLMYEPFKKLSKLSTNIQQGLTGADRIFEILDETPKIVDPETPLKLPKSNDILFKNVSFSYNVENDDFALRDINLSIKEGQRYALVGLSGAGKSTLVDLLPRFIDPQSGTVKIGGVNVKDLTLKDLRSKIAMVSQHTFLFNDTVYNNISYGNLEATREDVYSAAKTAFAYDFINKLPNKFDSIVGESGHALSGGERQRISIARAILKNAPILILDEATASLDNQSEREVQEALEKLASNRTCLVIAHRLSTILNSDCIVVMKSGSIVEMGTHEKLLSLNGEYKKLYDLQFKEDK
ncbi:MAG: ABC transporter ATP-binding protein [Bdellovibrionota bacterium]